MLGLTGVFGLVCLGSLWSSRPLMFRFAFEFVGAETPKGRDFAGRWRYAGFRHTFQVITAVWGVAYLAEAVVRVIIVESSSAGAAFTISKIMPYAVAAIAVAWMIPYSLRAKRRGEALTAARATRARCHLPRERPGGCDLCCGMRNKHRTLPGSAPARAGRAIITACPMAIFPLHCAGQPIAVAAQTIRYRATYVIAEGGVRES